MPKKIESFTSFSGYEQFINDVNKFLKIHDGNIEEIQYAIATYGDRSMYRSVMIVYREEEGLSIEDRRLYNIR